MASGWVAKVARPKLVDLYPRKRLFQRLDALRQNHSIPWIFAPAGSGKTALLVSYVETGNVPAFWYRVDEGDRGAEDLFLYMRRALELFEQSGRAIAELPAFSPKVDLAHFSRRFFEALFARLPAGTLVVFDDYHLAPEESAWQLAVEKALGCVPPELGVVVLSRRPPPAPLARLRVHGELALVEGHELRLTEAETTALAKRRLTGARVRPTRETLREVHAATGGWAAGVSLLLRRDSKAAVPSLDVDADVQSVFDYLASAVFFELTEGAQQVLTHAAFLPRFTARQAVELSGNAQAGAELYKLYRAGLFLECDNADQEAYHLHALFRSFLEYRATQAMTAESLIALRARAAALLRAEGQVEEAFELLLALGDYPALLSIVTERAPALFAEGRITLLGQWLSVFPARFAEQSGWLSYWSAKCTLMTAPAASRPAFERALQRFIEERDGAGAYLAWAGVVDAGTYDGRSWKNIDVWLNHLTQIESFCPAFPSADVGSQVVSALLMRLTLGGAEASTLEHWATRALALAENSNDPTVKAMTASVLLLNYALHGDSGPATRLAAELRAWHDTGPAALLAQVATKGAMTALAWHQGDSTAGLRLAREGLALMGKRSVPMWETALLVFGSSCALDLADQDELEEYCRRMGEIAEGASPIEVGGFQATRAHVAFARGDLNAALHAMELDLDNSRAGQFWYGEGHSLVAIAYILLELGHADRGRETLQVLRELEQSSKEPILTYWRLIIEADRALSDGDRPSAVELLPGALAVGRENQIFAQPFVPRRRIATLCRLALEQGIEPEYTRTLIRRRKLTLDPPPLELSDWPWLMQVRTLGGLEILVEDTPLGLGRATMVPLLLKAIVAFSAGGAHPVATSRLADALWPDADGDSAAHAFDVTLLRLRKQLGPDARRLLRLQNERVFLDRSLCWTDIGALDVVLKEIESYENRRVADGSAAGALRSLSERLFSLYRGPFAEPDDLPPALLSFDERLLTRVAAAARALGRHMEDLGETAGAEALSRRLLEVDARTADERFERRLASSEY